ncbi:MAG: hypothetical protein K8R39_02190 [Arcobacteraceae bacterium]|nr:hypothetical protein [Arcobacteraceae bacterium]
MQKKEDKRDKVKIKGIMGIIGVIISFICIKYATVYNLFPENKILVVSIFFFTSIIGIFMAFPFIQRLMGSDKYY